VYRTNKTGDLKRHKAMIHAINVVWHDCPELGCDLTTHKASIHDIGVQWKEYPHCDHKSKQTGDLNKHIKNMLTSE